MWYELYPIVCFVLSSKASASKIYFKTVLKNQYKFLTKLSFSLV